MTIQKSKERYKIHVVRKKDGAILQDTESTSSYGGAWAGHLAIPKVVGEVETYVIKVKYLGEHQFRTPYEKRVAARKRSAEAHKKHLQEEAEKSLVLRRNRIMNQIELAFVKNGKDAVKFVTCDECDDVAKVLALTHENRGSQVISPEQITGALCESHALYRPYKTTAVIECSRLEFFYDGIKQIYINKQM